MSREKSRERGNRRSRHVSNNNNEKKSQGTRRTNVSGQEQHENEKDRNTCVSLVSLLAKRKNFSVPPVSSPDEEHERVFFFFYFLLLTGHPASRIDGEGTEKGTPPREEFTLGNSMQSLNQSMVVVVCEESSSCFSEYLFFSLRLMIMMCVKRERKRQRSLYSSSHILQ